MGKKVVFKTHLENPPGVLEYWWGENEPARFPVGEDRILEGLTGDYPRIVQLKVEWMLEEIEMDVEEKKDAKGAKGAKSTVEEVP